MSEKSGRKRKPYNFNIWDDAMDYACQQMKERRHDSIARTLNEIILEHKNGLAKMQPVTKREQ